MGRTAVQPAVRFLDEIPAELVDWQRARVRRSAARRGSTGRPWRRLAGRPGVRVARQPAGHPRCTPGDRVTHDSFGLGTCVRVEGEGDKAMAHVDFGADTGVKRLLLRYAPLEKL